MSTNDKVTLFRWELKDFWAKRDDAGFKHLTSDLFTLSSRTSVQFALFIKHANMTLNDIFRVTLKQFDDKPLETSIKLWMESTKGQKFGETFVEKHTFVKSGDFCSIKGFGGDAYKSFKDLYDKHETFYFCCELVDLSKTESPVLVESKEPKSSLSETESSVLVESKEPKSSLSKYDQEFYEDQWALHEEGLYDAIVKAGNDEFKVSKFVFMAHSKVFKDMFVSNYKEGIITTIDINDIEKETMKHLIKWLYTGQFEENSPIEKLFTAANTYDIHLLKKICMDQMHSNMNEENVFQRLITASLHNDEKLKEAALNYIDKLKKSHIVKFFSSSEWHDFYLKNASVSKKISDLICAKFGE